MKRIKLFLGALLIALTPTFVLAPRALAATESWDGGGGDNNMTTNANWLDDTAPLAGDDLVFPAGITDRTVVNDFAGGTSFNTIVFNGTASSDSDYTISGNSMELVAGINNSMTGSSNKSQTISMPLTLNGNQTFQSAGGGLTLSGTIGVGTSVLTVTPNSSAYFSFSGVISGSGNMTKSGTGTLSLSGNSSSYSGAITASAGRLAVGHNSGLGATSGATTVNAGADLSVGNCSNMTVAENITLTGDSSNTASLGKLTVGAGCSGGGAAEVYGTAAVTGDITLSGNITLGSNITVTPMAETSTLTGAISGNFAISLMAGYGGKLVVDGSSNNSQTDNGTYGAPVLEESLTNDLPSTTVGIFGNTVVTLTGTRSDITVGAGATLKGTGTAGIVSVVDDGTIAPGLSPGCLTVTGLTLAGDFDAELGGTTACTGYDQTVVNGAVDLTGGTLNLTLVNDFKPAAGNKFAIVSNDAADAVVGTFAGLAQGATFTVSGYTFSVSYTGGDGNDVELTVTAVPPATGFNLVSNNPAVTLAALLAAAGAVALLARRQFKFSARKR
jgi:autotransporter-associated beta strand protein